MSSITRRRRSKGPDTRSAVEDVIVGAMERLLAGGRNFTSVSVEELAQEAGISRSTFYMHFRDKAELVRRLMKHVTRELLEAAAVWLESPQVADRARLRAALRQVAEVYDKHRAIMLAVAETAAYDPDVAAMFRETMDRFAGDMRAALKRAQREGQADVKLTPEVADALVWMVERCCHQLLGVRKPAQRERMIDAFTVIVWNTMFGATPQG